MTNGNTTTVLWNTFTGARLEELLYGLLQEMGAHDVVWRAGTKDGVNATDGGRDIEAIFDRPTPEGELDRERWWVEAKGRSKTVEQTAVQGAVFGVRPEVDVLVIATNSRFPNGVRDWVSAHQEVHPRPKIRLWDKDTLSKQVEKYPLVIARLMPEALGKEDRLSLLLERWEALGETPTEIDRKFFWDNKNSILECEDAAHVIMMFVYAELIEGDLEEHRWLSLICEENSFQCLMACYIQAHLRFMKSGSDRRSSMSLMKTSALIWVAAVRFIDSTTLLIMTENPTRAYGSNDEEANKVFQEALIAPILENARLLLATECTNDCARVSAEFDYLGSSPRGEDFWRWFSTPKNPVDDRIIIFEASDVPCAVGFDVVKGSHPTGGCPLIVDDQPDKGRLALDLQRVSIFREKHPSGQFLRFSKEKKDTIRKMAAGIDVSSGNPVMDAALNAYLDKGDAPSPPEASGKGDRGDLG